jgi:hypothetical protein
MKFLNLTTFTRTESCMVGTKRLLINADHITYISTVEHLNDVMTVISLDSPHAGGESNATSITLKGDHVQPLMFQLLGRASP